MRRRTVLVTLAGSSAAASAGCLGVLGGGGGGQGSCAPPSTDDLQSLFPTDTDTFTGQYGSSSGLSDIGTEDYFVGRYTGPNGDAHGLLVAKYSSQSDAEGNLESVLSEATAPATGYVITGQYLIVVDSQSRALGRQLVRESELDDGCASGLTFVSGDSQGDGGDGATATPTETTGTGEGTPDSSGTLLESFERQAIGYATDVGTAASISTDRSYDGARALRWQSETRNDGTIDTQDVQLSPPVTVEWYVYKEGGKDAGFVFGVQDSPSGYKSGDKYVVDSRSSGGNQSRGQLYVYKYEDGTETVLASTGVGQTPPEEQWNRYRLDWRADGSMTVTAYDGPGTTLSAEVRATDGTFSGGGIGWRSDDPDNVAYYDNLREL